MSTEEDCQDCMLLWVANPSAAGVDIGVRYLRRSLITSSLILMLVRKVVSLVSFTLAGADSQGSVDLMRVIYSF